MLWSGVSFSWSGLGTASQQSSWMYWMTRLSHQWIFSSLIARVFSRTTMPRCIRVWDALLHTTVMCGYLFLAVELLLSGRFLFFAAFSTNWWDFCVWSQQSEIIPPQTTLSGTNNHSTVKVTQITFLSHSVIWSEQQLNLLTISACCDTFSCCHMIGWLNISITKLVHRST